MTILSRNRTPLHFYFRATEEVRRQESYQLKTTQFSDMHDVVCCSATGLVATSRVYLVNIILKILMGKSKDSTNESGLTQYTARLLLFSDYPVKPSTGIYDQTGPQHASIKNPSPIVSHVLFVQDESETDIAFSLEFPSNHIKHGVLYIVAPKLWGKLKSQDSTRGDIGQLYALQN